MKGNFSKSLADVALVFSPAVRDFGADFSGIKDLLGTSQLLTDAHIQHDILILEDLQNKLTLNKYKLIILTSHGNMSTKTAYAIRQYVDSGGILLATGNTSLLTKTGNRRESFELADIMGVNCNTKPLLVNPLIHVQFLSDNHIIKMPRQYFCHVHIRDGAKIIATGVDEKTKNIYPFLVYNKYGKGQVWYLTMPLGIENCEPEYKVNTQINFQKNKEIADLYLKIINQYIIKNNFNFRPINIPEKVIVNTFQQTTDQNKSILIHLLNATGTELKKGEIIRGKRNWGKNERPFPPIKEDIVFDIKQKNIKEAIIVSPDYKNEYPAIISPHKKVYSRIVVNKEYLKAYSIVYLKIN
jgi:hypothetical protein